MVFRSLIRTFAPYKRRTAWASTNLENLLNTNYMEKFFITLLLAVFSSVSFAQNETALKFLNKEQIKNLTFDKITHDFGKVSVDSKDLTCTFTFTNTGDYPIQIVQCKTPNINIIAEFPTEPIEPGKKGTIKVIYKKLFAGNFTKAILITTTTGERTRVQIKGTAK